MDSALKVFRSQSTRRERLTQPCTLPMSPSMLPNDLSLPFIDQSFCRLSPEPLRSITPSTKSTSPLNTELSPFKSQLPLDLPIVTAKAWSVCDGQSGDILWAVNGKERREMASLTKITTCYIVLRLLKRIPGVSLYTSVKVSKTAAQVIGTSADLEEGDEVTVWDLLHGLMLPSGNDAAYCLAEFFGRLLHDCLEKESPSRNYVSYFVRKMNSFAKKHKLRSTSFSNPHGLADPTNRSNATDLAKLASLCMRNSRFRELVSTKRFTSLIYQPQRRCYKRLTWLNTNKLLDGLWIGVKTGVTHTAGPCLIACCKTETKHQRLIIVLLGCNSLEQRWTEASLLANWATDKFSFST